MGIVRKVDGFNDVAHTYGAREVLSVKDAATLIIRNFAYCGRFDFYSFDENWEDVYTEEFRLKTLSQHKIIVSEIMKALKNKELKSDSYYHHVGLLGDVAEPPAKFIYLDPDSLEYWLTNQRGEYLSDFWRDDVNELFFETIGRIGMRIEDMRKIVSACVVSRDFHHEFINKSFLTEHQPEPSLGKQLAEVLLDKPEKAEIDVSEDEEADFIDRLVSALKEKQVESSDSIGQIIEEREPSDSSKEAYLTIIGAVVTVLAELDATGQRPLKNKKLVLSSGRISSEGLKGVLLDRFKKDRYLRRSDVKIKEALKLIEDYK